MFRILIALGSVLLEVATVMSEGMIAISLLVAGSLITFLHVTAESHPFQTLVNRLSGFDLPETLEPVRNSSPVENHTENRPLS